MLPDEYSSFVEEAVAFSSSVGYPGLVLVVGSRGAGYADSWSDLDLWILGEKCLLTGRDRQEYDTEGQLFRDRGDSSAHWTFYDWSDATARLDKGEPIFTWVATRSTFLNGPKELHEGLLAKYSDLSTAIAAEHLRKALGTFMIESGGGIARAARRDVVAGVAATGAAIAAASRICLLADRKPYPYEKWIVEAARDTRLGDVVVPILEEVVATIGELVSPPPGVDFREWTPIAKIRALRSVFSDRLPGLGWQEPWASDLGLNVPVAFQQN